MPLVLTLHRARAPADRQRESRTLDEGSLTIGRGPGNGWVLLDPAQHLSKTHCVVSSAPGGYVLQDCSSNGVFLNGSPHRMARDSRAAIADGDEFTLGDYLIQVRVVATLSSRTVTASAAGVPRGAPSAIDRDDPFGLDEFLAPAPAPAALAPLVRAPAAPQFDPFADPVQARRDDPFGDGVDELLGSPAPTHRPFGDPAPRNAAPPPRDPFDASGGPEPARRGRDAFGDDDDLFRGQTPAAEWQGPSQPDNVDAAAYAYTPPKAPPPLSTDNWDDLLGDTPPAAPFAAAPAATVAPASAPPPPVPAAPAPAATGADAARLIQAFLDGAGVAGLDVSAHEPEAYLRAAGELFGAMVESLRDVLMSRAVVKGEFGVEQTMLRPRDNNALKFSVTPADAVAALLQPGRPGYMEPMRATREAFDDVRVHQLAVMAGVQAALFNLLKTFDPAALEAHLQKGGMVESILPGTRRAKLWDAFCDTYKDIARDADSDFQAVFGREFARAYTQQVRSI